MKIIIISSIIFVILLAVGATLYLILRKKISQKLKGYAGEKKVAFILGNTISGQQYVINDLTFRDSSGHTCQIDHIYINQNGIWVIETKNYSGLIYGNENQREWTQVLAYGHTKNHFYNPIKQNTTHIYRLSEYLDTQNIFQNIVVFLNNADISNITAENVYSIYDLKTIKNRITNVYLTVEEMERYYGKLLFLKVEGSTISRKEHIDNINDMQQKLQQGICPRCGKSLILRTGRNGQFYGCSSYPKCKFTKNLNW